MITKQCLEAFEEAYEVVGTKIVCINGRTFRVEVRKCLKGKLDGKFDCDYYEDDCVQPEVKGKDSKAKKIWNKIAMPWVAESDANAAMKRALGWIAENLSAGSGK